MIGFDDFGERDTELWQDYFVARDNPFEEMRARIDWAYVGSRCTLTQRRVLEMLAEGFTTNEISERLHLSAGRISQIKRTELAAIVAECGYAPTSAPVVDPLDN